ncbi:MAG: hypothetical protein K2X98_01120 [Alphaproteobacteria bacterium]|nr:hypothetical protein [Alphaproteobacteria bacterium]
MKKIPHLTLALLLTSNTVPIVAMDEVKQQPTVHCSTVLSIPDAAHTLIQTFSDNPNAFNVEAPRKVDPGHHQDHVRNDIWPFSPSDNKLSQAIVEKMVKNPEYFTSGAFTADLKRVSKSHILFDLPQNAKRISDICSALASLEKHGIKKQLSSVDIRNSARLVDEEGKELSYKFTGAAVLYLQNLAMIAEDPSCGERIGRTIASSSVYNSPNIIDISDKEPPFKTTKITIENGDLVSVAMKMNKLAKDQGLKKKFGLIIPGDEVNVGGGPTEANAAEENIGRVIPYALLSQVAIAEGHGYPLPAHGVLVIDDVDVMRDPITLDLLPKDHVFPVTLINSAAPDLRTLIKQSFRDPLLKAHMESESVKLRLASINNDGDRKKEGWKIEAEFLATPEYTQLLSEFRNAYYKNHPEYRELVINKVDAQVRASIKCSVTDLFVPAWGSNVFENDIDFIADVYNDVLQKYPGYFNTVSCIVFPDGAKALNEAAFQKITGVFGEQ